jgi:RNA polymerase sigma factor (sigma-70 family)
MKSTRDDPSRRERFERLYVATRVAMLGYLIRRVSDPTDAGDLLAETYLVAWRKLDDIAKDEEVRLWLYGVARRVASHHHRHERVERGLAEALRADLTRESAVLRADPDVPFGEMICASLDRLKPIDREIIELSAWEQLTPTEIAAVIGMKPGAVRVRLHRIRTAMRTELVNAGYPRADPRDDALPVK